jgi:hypothetical protein
MAGLVPAIHAIPQRRDRMLKRRVLSLKPMTRYGVDARDKRGHDGTGFAVWVGRV